MTVPAVGCKADAKRHMGRVTQLSRLSTPCGPEHIFGGAVAPDPTHAGTGDRGATTRVAIPHPVFPEMWRSTDCAPRGGIAL